MEEERILKIIFEAIKKLELKVCSEKAVEGCKKLYKVDYAEK